MILLFAGFLIAMGTFSWPGAFPRPWSGALPDPSSLTGSGGTPAPGSSRRDDRPGSRSSQEAVRRMDRWFARHGEGTVGFARSCPSCGRTSATLRGPPACRPPSSASSPRSAPLRSPSRSSTRGTSSDRPGRRSSRSSRYSTTPPWCSSRWPSSTSSSSGRTSWPRGFPRGSLGVADRLRGGSAAALNDGPAIAIRVSA